MRTRIRVVPALALALALPLVLALVAAPGRAQLVADSRSAVSALALERAAPVAALAVVVVPAATSAGALPFPVRDRSWQPYVLVGAAVGGVAAFIWVMSDTGDCFIPALCVSLLLPIAVIGGTGLGGAAGFVVWVITRPFVGGDPPVVTPPPGEVFPPEPRPRRRP